MYPDDTLLLVDTVDTLGSGIPNAIATFERLRRAGHEPVGVRLDSGDLAYLAVQAARELDRAGFPDTVIVLSSQLDELTIWQITSQIADEARRHGVDPDDVIGRLVFGVGSRLATSDGDPSLDGVFKLVAVDDGSGAWRPAMKRSDSPVKVLNPGAKRLWRVYDDAGRAVADVLSTAGEELRAGERITLHHHARPDVSRLLTTGDVDELLSTVVDGGRIVCRDARRSRRRRRSSTRDIDALDPGVRRLVNPHTYHVSITDDLFTLKQSLLAGLDELRPPLTRLRRLADGRGRRSCPVRRPRVPRAQASGGSNGCHSPSGWARRSSTATITAGWTPMPMCVLLTSMFSASRRTMSMHVCHGATPSTRE